MDKRNRHLEDPLNQYSPSHLIGISGIGMLGLSLLLQQLNVEISGSDINLNSQYFNYLPKKNCYNSHHKDHLGASKSVIYSSAIPNDNPEIIHAKAQNLKLFSRAEMLKKISCLFQDCIAVSGTHGKTTTSSLISHILRVSGKNPSYYIGGFPINFKVPAAIHSKDLFVVETDESDGSFFNIPASISVITNLDHDHLNYYKTFENLVDYFKSYIKSQVEKASCIVLNADNPTLAHIITSFSSHKIISFGQCDNADLEAQNISYTTEGLQASLYFKKKYLGNVSSTLMGKHNLENIMAASTCCLAQGIPFSDIKNGVKSFLGTKSRLECLKKDDNYTFYLDYAHHPTAIKSTLESFNYCVSKRLIVVFQPHRFSRLHASFDAIVQALTLADLIFVTPVFSANEKNSGLKNSHDLVETLKSLSCSATLLNNCNDTLLLTQILEKKDIVIFMGAGDIKKLASKTLRELYTKNLSAEHA